MKLLLAILLIAAFGYLAGMYLPWFSIAIVCFVIAFFIPLKPGYGFLAGFTGIFLLWTMIALWLDVSNNSILSHKVAQLFPLGGSSILLILVTAIVGALVGGFAAMSGSLMRSLIIKKAH